MCENQTGTLFGWGAGHTGILGAGPEEDQPTPQQIPGLPPVSSVVAGGASAYAIDSNGSVLSWGWDAFCHMLGLGKVSFSKPWLATPLRSMGYEFEDNNAEDGGVGLPTVVTGLPPVSTLSVAENNVFALTSEGDVWIWGDAFGIGRKARNNLDRPKKIEALEGISQIASSLNGATCYLLDENKQVWSWGNGYEGQLGHGKLRNQHDPQIIPALSNVQSIHASDLCAFALLEDGTVWFWGNGEFIDLTIRGTYRIKEPTIIDGLSDIASLFVGPSSCLAINTKGETWAVGESTWESMLNLNLETRNAHLARVAELDSLNKYYLGDSHGLAISTDGELLSFGYAEGGGLGNGCVGEEYFSPIKVQEMSNVITAAAGIGFSLAIVRNDG